MPQRMVAEPDYDFKLEVISGGNLVNRVFFSNEVLIAKCISGRAEIFINTERHEFATNTNFILVDGVMFKLIESSSDFKVALLRFSPNFFNVIYPMLEGKAIEAMRYSAPDLYKKEDMEMMNLMFDQLCNLYHNHGHMYRNRMAVNIIINYILEIYEQTYRHVLDRAPEKSDHRSFLIDRFFALCAKQYSHHRKIEYYASQLSITSRYLYKICKQELQMTPKQCIDYMVSGNIKKLLMTTNLNHQQISNDLNFPDQATFGQFFKRNVGMTPSEFRTKFK